MTIASNFLPGRVLPDAWAWNALKGFDSFFASRFSLFSPTTPPRGETPSNAADHENADIPGDFHCSDLVVLEYLYRSENQRRANTPRQDATD
ncbi:hypothetical protein [Burkholderia sp. 22PA0106]|uniref:hypothetical protein n=1 Tax=Burkholderia sp. 22PA0106 TaxID=3237371 RepID=UPI0039C2DC42